MKNHLLNPCVVTFLSNANNRLDVLNNMIYLLNTSLLRQGQLMLHYDMSSAEGICGVLRITLRKYLGSMVISNREIDAYLKILKIYPPWHYPFTYCRYVGWWFPRTPQGFQKRVQLIQKVYNLEIHNTIWERINKSTKNNYYSK